MIADENGAIILENSNCFPDRNGYSPKYIILHGTANSSFATAQDVAYYFQGTENTNNPVSAHYIVGLDGTIVQCNSEKDGAWANGYLSAGHDSFWSEDINPNNLTISIEHVKTTIDNSTSLTLAQKNASFKLIQHICARHSIPLEVASENGGITGHFSVDPVNRARCPGNFPWTDLWQFLQENGDSMLSISQAAEYFQEIELNQRWRCLSTNFDIAYGILQYYRTCTQTGLNGLSQYGLPLSNEESIPDLEGVTFQRFERGVICYDPSRKNDSVPGLTGTCYPMHIDKGQGQDPRIIAAIQKQQQAAAQAAISATPAAPPVAEKPSIVTPSKKSTSKNK